MSQGVECYSCLPKTAWPPTWGKETEIAVARIARSKARAREIVMAVDVETGTGMDRGTRITLLPNHRNPAIRSNRKLPNREAEIFLHFGSISAFSLFSQSVLE